MKNGSEGRKGPRKKSQSCDLHVVVSSIHNALETTERELESRKLRGCDPSLNAIRVSTVPEYHHLVPITMHHFCNTLLIMASSQMRAQDRRNLIHIRGQGPTSRHHKGIQHIDF